MCFFILANKYGDNFAKAHTINEHWEIILGNFIIKVHVVDLHQILFRIFDPLYVVKCFAGPAHTTRHCESRYIVYKAGLTYCVHKLHLLLPLKVVTCYLSIFACIWLPYHCITLIKENFNEVRWVVKQLSTGVPYNIKRWFLHHTILITKGNSLYFSFRVRIFLMDYTVLYRALLLNEIRSV